MKIFLKRFFIWSFLFIYFLLIKNNSVFAIGANGSKAVGDNCLKNSDCVSSCCLPDVNAKEELKYYYYAKLNYYVVEEIPSVSGVQSICWDKSVCNDGYSLDNIAVANCGCLNGGVVTGRSDVSGVSACFSGTVGSYESGDSSILSWKCTKMNVSTICSARIGGRKETVGAMCFSKGASSSAPIDPLCACGTVTKRPERNGSEWNWTCGEDAECSSEYVYPAISNVPEVNPLPSSLTAVVKTTSNIGSNLNGINLPTQTTGNYRLLEKLSQKCTVIDDKDCEVIDSKFSEAITLKMTIKEAIEKGNLNKKWRIGLDNSNYEKSFTLENIKKLKVYRILPIGFEIAARCIRGETECADGKIHEDLINNTTLENVIDGYNNCNIESSGENGPFCHLVNPNWILKAPTYMCESGSVYSNILLSTSTVSDVNSRYEYCPDVSSCLSENENGDCNAFGYCMKEKNVWRFGVSADKCSKEEIGCTQYSYIFNKNKEQIGLVKDSVDKGVCDTESSGCRKYSAVSTSRINDSGWISNNLKDKIFLNNNIEACDSKEEGCNSFIRRDVANLIRNSSFENNDGKNIDLFISHGNGTNTLSNTKTPIDGDFVASIKTTLDNSISGYELDKNNYMAVEPLKTYTLSYYVVGDFSSGSSNEYIDNYGYGAFVNIKEYNSSKTIINNTPYNYLDNEAFRFVNVDVGSTFQRKIIVFKTSENTKYINLILVLSNKVGNAYFDALQLEEGQVATSYKTYENSPKNYMKKAPDYMNCYDSGTTNKSEFCSNFVASCDESNAGCRKYTKTDDSEFWLPGKISENNVCPASCKNYESYMEGGPAYNKEDGKNFRALISSTATTCSSSSAGCSKFYNLDDGQKTEEYFSSIESCVKESSLGDGSTSKPNKEFADYFTYTGSETSGFKLNVYRLLRAQYCNGTLNKCLSDTDCGGTDGSCKYNDSDTYFAPAQKNVRDLSCNEKEYSKIDADPNCREFHGPKNLVEAKTPNSDNSNYILYYVNMSDVVRVSDKECSYYEIALDNNILNKAICDKASFLPENRADADGKYKYDNKRTCLSGSDAGKECSSSSDCAGVSISCDYDVISCNIGIYKSESEVCSASENGCREYKGTAVISETLLYDDIEENDVLDWKKENGEDINTSNESVRVNFDSIRIDNNSYGFKNITNEIVESKDKSYYKISLYAKSSNNAGSIKVKMGDGNEVTKILNNDWRFLTFGIWSSDDIKNSKEIKIINSSGIGAIFVDYIKLEKSESEYLIKDTWNTPISCDNNYENPQGVCTSAAAAAGYCEITAEKVCLTGNNLGVVCTASNFASVCGSSDDVCDYQNKYCTSETDVPGNSCNANLDCYVGGVLPEGRSDTDIGICEPSNNGYRLAPGKMIGCNQYTDSYNNNGHYVFNDLSLCQVDQMGCEAVYDTYNSNTYKKENFNESVKLDKVAVYYNFNDKNNLGKNSVNSYGLSLNGASYENGIDDGSIKLTGTINALGYGFREISGDANKITIGSWVKPGAGATGSIIKKVGSFDLSINALKIKCSIGGVPTDSYTTTNSVLETNAWNNVVCSYDGSRISIYVNGYLKEVSDEKNITFGYDDNNGLSVGGNNISLDNLIVYEKALTQEEILSLYRDYEDNVIVKADELKYLIINAENSCDSKYVGCTALGRSTDKYDKSGEYGTVYYLLNPEKFKSSASNLGVNSNNLCKAEEEGCYSFNGVEDNFKFPERICSYAQNVDVGDNKKESGWFKYDSSRKSLTAEGCYSGYGSPYELRKLNGCEYKTAMVKRGVDKAGKVDPIGYGIIGKLNNETIKSDLNLSEVTGWFKKDSTKGCSDDGDYVVEISDYRNLYNGSVGSCTELGCTEFIDPSENVCKSGNRNGYECISNSDCGSPFSACVYSFTNKASYCVFQDASYGYGVTLSRCKSNTDCGFSGECSSNTVYTYFDNGKIDIKSCDKVGVNEGCILFNKTNDTNLKWASEETYIRSNKNNGASVSAQVAVAGDVGSKKGDSNVIVKVTKDRECSEWLAFGDTYEFSNKDNSSKINTCTALRADGSCDIGSGKDGGWNSYLSTSEYVGKMTGNWSDSDYSGFSIFNEPSVNNNWWKSTAFTGGYGVTIKATNNITQGTVGGVLDNLICKKYPEKDSPFNFSDKYTYLSEEEFIIDSGYSYGYGYYCSGDLYASSESCGNVCYFGDRSKGYCFAGESNYRCCIKKDAVMNNAVYDYGLPYDVYKNRKIRKNFDSANSGVSVAEHDATIYNAENPIRFIVSDMQDCYYQRATYTGLYENQFYQGYNSREPAFESVCNEFSGYGCFKDIAGSYTKNYPLKEVKDYSQKNTNKIEEYRQGYCLEFDLSKEIYYTGSGKYNCINWVPGFVK